MRRFAFVATKKRRQRTYVLILNPHIRIDVQFINSRPRLSPTISFSVWSCELQFLSKIIQITFQPRAAFIFVAFTEKIVCMHPLQCNMPNSGDTRCSSIEPWQWQTVFVQLLRQGFYTKISFGSTLIVYQL